LVLISITRTARLPHRPDGFQPCNQITDSRFPMREFPAARPAAQPRRRVLSVSSLTRRIKDLLESEYADVWVEGEISNLSRPGSGHVYFSLKDERCQIRCALFRGRRRWVATELEDGARVLVRARLTMYEARGDAQLVVQEVEDAGEGALRRAFEALKRKLQEEGLFDERHKRPLPVLPRRVGIITSPTGAAIRDIVATFRRRFPAIPLLVHPVSVQGERAVDDILAALQTASRDGLCDVLILARGGGSLEDLQAFNDERVARAVFECEIPVVSGVGHETDVTICDFVADQRAPTPTAAAELVSPDAGEWVARVTDTERRLIRQMLGRLEQSAQRVDWLSRLIVHPRQQLKARAERLQAVSDAHVGAMRSALQARRLNFLPLPARLLQSGPSGRLQAAGSQLKYCQQRLQRAMSTGLSRRRQALEHAMRRLDSVNPLSVIARGYAMVTQPDSGGVIRSIDQAQVGDPVEVRLSDGRLQCSVTGKRAND
ncbi:MAG TPA: exodeoxyribonuclease VII large subunit, partial [Arenicellales bacterium]|nr:exodeoxyribonuclease VII large subunit [Arenicellales bacterium]